MVKRGWSLTELMGQIVLAINPWHGTPYMKKYFYFRKPAPWYYKRWGGGKLSPKQLRICKTFARVAKETAGMRRVERIEEIAKRMKELVGKKKVVEVVE